MHDDFLSPRPLGEFRSENEKFLFYGEWVYYSYEEEKEKATQYLNSWKYFLLKKLPLMQQDGEDYWIDRSYPGSQENTLGLKIAMKKIGKC
jgi:hypothetical protein